MRQGNTTVVSNPIHEWRRTSAFHIPLRRALLVALAILASAILLPSMAGADTFRRGSTTLISIKPDGTAADGAEPSISEDGRYVAFTSTDQLVAEDTDSYADVYLYRRDVLTQPIVLVSVEATGIPRSQENFRPSISGDGSKVAYLSGACFTFEAETGDCVGVYAHVRDVAAASTKIVSDARYRAAAVDLSRDGLWAAIVHERDGEYRAETANVNTGQLRWFAGLCSGCIFDLQVAISGTGRFIAFESDDSQIPSDTDGQVDIYRYDRDTDGNGGFDEPGKTAIALASIVPGGEVSSRKPDVSDDGGRVAFYAEPTVERVSTLGFLAYVRDFTPGTTTLLSQTTQGLRGSGAFYQLGNLSIGGVSGNKIAFSSWDPLAPPDTNPFMDAYLRDTSSSTTSLVSVLPDGNQDVGDKAFTSVSYDGRFVAFSSSRLTWRTTIDRRVYLRNLETGCSTVCLP